MNCTKKVIGMFLFALALTLLLSSTGIVSDHSDADSTITMDANYSYADAGVVVRFTSPTTLPVDCTVSIMSGLTTIDSVEVSQGSSTIFIERALAAGTYYVAVVGNGVVGTSSTFIVNYMQTYTIIASAGTGGSISPSGNVSVISGESKEFTITANSGYSVSSVIVDGVSKGAITSYIFSDVVEEGHTIAVTFTANPGPTPTITHTVVASAGTGGSISPSGVSIVTDGSSKIFTVTADIGYDIGKVLVDGSAVTLADGKYTFSNVVANHTISVSFKSITKEMITVEATDGGSISPSGSFEVDKGSSQTFTLTPENGFKVDKVTVNGKEVSLENNKFTLDDITSDLEIQVSFTSNASISDNDNTIIIIIIVIVMLLIISGTIYYIVGVKKRP